MKLPDKRLISLNSLESPLDFKSRLNSNSRMNGAKVKYAIVQIANKTNLMLINRLAHLCDMFTIWNNNGLTLIIHWILNNWRKKLNSAIIYIGPISARYRKPTSIFRHLADIGPIWECLLGWFTSTGHFTRQTTICSTGACATGGYRTLTLRLEVRSTTNSVDIQSTLVISKSSGFSHISRDIRLSRYQ